MHHDAKCMPWHSNPILLSVNTWVAWSWCDDVDGEPQGTNDCVNISESLFHHVLKKGESGLELEQDEQTHGVTHKSYSTSIRMVQYIGDCQETVLSLKYYGDNVQNANRYSKLRSISIRKANLEEEKVNTHTQVQRSGFCDSARKKRLRQIGAEMVWSWLEDSIATTWGWVARRGCKTEAQCKGGVGAYSSSLVVAAGERRGSLGVGFENMRRSWVMNWRAQQGLGVVASRWLVGGKIKAQGRGMVWGIIACHHRYFFVWECTSVFCLSVSTREVASAYPFCVLMYMNSYIFRI